MNFLQPSILWAVPLIALPILIHLINQWRYQTRRWAPMIFLLQANRMNRGLAKIRQWLILAMRTLAIAGLIFAVSRPLVGGLWGMLAGGRIDTSIVLLDRSPSMSDQGSSGETKMQAAIRQLTSALHSLEAARWVAMDSTTAQATEFADLDALMGSAVTSPSSATAQIPLALHNALEYIQVNQPGSVDIWLCTDLRTADWQPDSGDWNVIRAGFDALPQEVRFHVLAFADQPSDNLAIRVTNAYRQEAAAQAAVGNELVLTIQILGSDSDTASASRLIPIQLEVEGVRSQLQVELTGDSAELRDVRIPLPAAMQSGWGKVSLPADSNNADNDYYFVFEGSSVPRVVLVTEDAQAARPLQIAASVTADGSGSTQVTVISPEKVDSELLQGVSLVIWQAELPDSLAAKSIDYYLANGGQVVFFPPVGLPLGNADSSRQYRGVRWTGWKQPGPNPVMVSNWLSDQDLLAATQSGAGLPVGQLEILGHGLLHSESALTRLATLDGGHHLLARLPTSAGGVYFCSAATDSSQSTLAENGIVLFVVVQRAILSGQTALQGMRQRVAGSMQLNNRPLTDSPSVASSVEPSAESRSMEALPNAMPNTSGWQQVAGPKVLSSEYDCQAGVYRDGSRLFAVNREESEDASLILEDQQLKALFDGLRMQRIDQSSDDSSSIFREVWRIFLVLVIVALVAEALLCLPKVRRMPAATSFRA